jgi:hypothetical protein
MSHILFSSSIPPFSLVRLLLFSLTAQQGIVFFYKEQTTSLKLQPVYCIFFLVVLLFISLVAWERSVKRWRYKAIFLLFDLRLVWRKKVYRLCIPCSPIYSGPMSEIKEGVMSVWQNTEVPGTPLQTYAYIIYPCAQHAYILNKSVGLLCLSFLARSLWTKDEAEDDEWP